MQEFPAGGVVQVVAIEADDVLEGGKAGVRSVGHGDGDRMVEPDDG